MSRNVHIFFNFQPNSNKPIEALCSTVGTKLARLELADFIETLNNRNDLAELVSGFRAYAYLSQERREILNEICTNYEEYLKTFIAVSKLITQHFYLLTYKIYLCIKYPF